MLNKATYKRRLRGFLIDPRFQLSFVAYFVVFSELTLMATYFCLVYFFQTAVTQFSASTHPEVLQLLEFFTETLKSVLLWVGLGSLVILTGGGIMLSHRVAGPLRQLERALQQLGDGNPPRTLKFRRGDYLGRIETAYNDAVARLLKHGVAAAPPDPDPT